MKWVVAIAGWLGVVATPLARAAIIDAADLSYDSVSNAVRVASAGDIVFVPAGHVSWTKGLVISNNIVLRSLAGAIETVITNEVPKTSPETPLIKTASTSSNGLMRISGFTFRGGITSTQTTFNGLIVLGGYCRSNVVTHCVFDSLWGVPMANDGFTLGVVASNSFRVRGTHAMIFGHPDWQPFNGATNSAGTAYTKGNGSWADDPYWGTDRFMFFERNYVLNTESPAVNRGFDAFEGARAVIRYNITTNHGVVNHGTEGQGRGAKQYEEYLNDFYLVGVSDQLGQIRGGSLLCWSNTYNGHTRGHVLRNYRQIHWRDGGWGWANGTNIYDLNLTNNPNGYWETGTHTGGMNSSSVTDSTKSWATGQWKGTNYGHQVWNLTKYAGLPPDQTPQGTITANTATTLTILNSDPALRFDFNDTYQIWRIARALDQPGAGKDNGLMNGGPPSTPAQWPDQIAEPIYAWGNTFNVETTQPNITEGRDWTNGVAKPGYTPYTYPHPLTFETLAITPAAPMVALGGTVDFDASTGSGSYYYRITVNGTGGSINSSTGLYTAGQIPAAVDTIQAVDLFWGNTVETTATTASSPLNSESLPFFFPRTRRRG